MNYQGCRKQTNVIESYPDLNGVGKARLCPPFWYFLDTYLVGGGRGHLASLHVHDMLISTVP